MNTRRGRSTPSGRGRRITAVTATIVAVASLLTAVPAAADDGPPAPYRGKPVPGQTAPALEKAGLPASSTSIGAVATRKLTAAGFDVATPTDSASTKSAITESGHQVAATTGKWQPVGDTGIQVAPTQAAPTPLTKQTKGTVSDPTDKVRVSVIDKDTAKKHGLSGLTLEVARADAGTVASRVAIRIPKEVLNRFGADYQSRLVWSQVNASGSKTAARTTVPATIDAKSGAVTIAPEVSATSMMIAATATPVSSTGTGSFAATPLKPASMWDVSAQTGDFSYSYPFAVPPAPAGLAPSLSLSYDSQSVDGETGSTNNQPSTVGEGWTLAGGGFIERSYIPCAIDNGASGPVTTSGDLCWKTDNATVSVGGHSGQLIKDTATGTWKLQADDNTRFEHLVGTAAGCAPNGTYDVDCWRMTTTDGTQYYFGMNQLPGFVAGNPGTGAAWTVPVYGNDPGEPCHAATFAASSCTQAWRWNLDYVVDIHNNAEAFYYADQTNHYLANGTTVTNYYRGGDLDHIDYGFTAGHAYGTNAASARISFGHDAYGRCSDATHANCTAQPNSGAAAVPVNAAYYPDVPFDQNCASGCAGLLSPTFWSTAMLSTVTTKVLKAGAYVNVDVWTLGHSFPAPGDGTNASLWMTTIGHTGYAGTTTATEPTTILKGLTLQNRVWALDGLAPLDKWRLYSVQSPLGGKITVSYSGQECTPGNAAAIEAAAQTNTARCFPQWWTPQVTPPQPAQLDLFHKYVVTKAVSDPVTGGGNDLVRETDYLYGTPAWRYDTSPLVPDDKRTWSVFAGYNTVEARVGDPNTPAAQTVTDYTYYQGMDGDRAAPAGGTKTVMVTGSATLPDARWFAGTVREQKSVGGVGGAVLTDTVTTPWASVVTADDGITTARHTGAGDTLVTQPLSAGGTRSVHTVTAFDGGTGLPLQVSTVPSDAIPSCATTTYAPANRTAWIFGKPAEVGVLDLDCANAASATFPDDVISDVRTTYDNAAWNMMPAQGDATQVQTAKTYSGTTPQYITTATTTYDALGRVLSTKDALLHTASTAYTPAAGAAVGSGGVTSITTTNQTPFNWTTTTTYDPSRGSELSATDQNGKVTSAAYDPLGRRTSVWLPSRPQASNPSSPSVGYTYTLSQTAPSTVKTATITGGGIVSTFTLYDGLGQQVQTQGPAEGGGTALTDTAYDGHGRVSFTDNAYYTTSVTPSTALFVPSSLSQIGSQTANTYDTFDRITKVTTNSYGTERFHTSSAYLGADRVDTTPPAGGTPTTTYTNSSGQNTSLIQYLATTPSATAAKETTSYTFNKLGKMSTMVDPVGNTWSWDFDLLGRQITATDPDTGTTTSSYDDDGNVLTTTDARAVTLAYTYDNLNRKTGEFVGSSAGAKLAAWTYDTVAKGQPTASISYVGSTPGALGAAYSSTVTGYDALYDVTGNSITLPASAPGFPSASYAYTATYNVDGSPATRVIPAMGGIAAETLTWSYGAVGNPTGLAGINTYGTFQYTAIGQLAQVGRGGTTTLSTAFAYDAATGNTSEIKDTTVAGGISTVQADRVYTRNNAGDVTGIATTGATGTDKQCFNYDYLHDLTQAWTPTSGNCATAPTATTIGGAAPYWTNYTIDPATGNRTQVIHNPVTSTGAATTDMYAYPAATAAHPHAVQTVTHTGGATGTTSYSYDATGNTTVRPGQSLTYDNAGKLSKVTIGSAAQTSIYDATGTLLLQSDPTNGTTLYLGETELHVATGSTSASAVRTYSDGSLPTAERTTKAGVSGSTILWLSGDANHTAALEVNPVSGAITHRYLDPYGNSRGTAIAWSSGHTYLNAPTNPFAALVQLGARAFDAILGRFTSVDPVLASQNPQQNNGYAYSANGPISSSDPDGKCYHAGSDFLDFHTICGGGSGTTAPQVAGQSQYTPPVGTYDDWAIRNKGDNHSVKGRYDSKASDSGISDLKSLSDQAEGAYASWASLQRYNGRLNEARQKREAQQELKPGSGNCASVSFGSASSSFCEIKTLDGKVSRTITVGGALGLGVDVKSSMGPVSTNARTADDLAGPSFGFHGSAAFGAGLEADQTWGLGDPSIHSTQVGSGLGLGAFLGAGGGFTFVLPEWRMQ